jgi:uncharacterized membrane protein
VHRTFAAALTAGALLWSAALLLAPFALRGPLSSGHASEGALRSAPPGLDGRNPFLATAATFIYQGGGLICHQRSERSFHIGGVQQPVCARCAGLYFSGAAGAVAAWIGWRRRPRAPRRTRLVLIAASVPTAVTVALEFAGIAHPSNSMRALAALPLGAAAGWVFVRLLRTEGDAPRGLR